MGRHKQPEIREQILEACVDHALAHGLPDRLEPLVAASGASARMLVYHFGSRDQLLRETLRRARRRQRDFYGDLLRPRQDEPYQVTLSRAWHCMTGPAGQPFLSMFGRLREAEEQTLWPDFRREATTDWLQPLEDGLRTVGRPELATLVLAVIRGLVLDVEATGDKARADGAFQAFCAALSLETTRDPGQAPGGSPRSSHPAHPPIPASPWAPELRGSVSTSASGHPS